MWKFYLHNAKGLAKKIPVSIKHIVDYKCLGIYMETDILQETITVGKGKKRICLNMLQAKKMNELLEKHISKIDSKHCNG